MVKIVQRYLALLFVSIGDIWWRRKSWIKGTREGMVLENLDVTSCHMCAPIFGSSDRPRTKQ